MRRRNPPTLLPGEAVSTKMIKVDEMILRTQEKKNIKDKEREKNNEDGANHTWDPHDINPVRQAGRQIWSTQHVGIKVCI